MQLMGSTINRISARAMLKHTVGKTAGARADIETDDSVEF